MIRFRARSGRFVRPGNYRLLGSYSGQPSSFIAGPFNQFTSCGGAVQFAFLRRPRVRGKQLSARAKRNIVYRRSTVCAHFLARRIDHVPGHAWSDTSGSSFASSTAVMQVGCTRGYTSARMIYEVFHCICDVESPCLSARAKNFAVSAVCVCACVCVYACPLVCVYLSLRRFFPPSRRFFPPSPPWASPVFEYPGKRSVSTSLERFRHEFACGNDGGIVWMRKKLWICRLVRKKTGR